MLIYEYQEHHPFLVSTHHQDMHLPLLDPNLSERILMINLMNDILLNNGRESYMVKQPLFFSIIHKHQTSEPSTSTPYTMRLQNIDSLNASYLNPSSL